MTLRHLLTSLWVLSTPLISSGVGAQVAVSCGELNKLYAEKYFDDFHIDGNNFNFRPGLDTFDCAGNDKNYKMAFAINLLEQFNMYGEGQFDYYRSMVNILDFRPQDGRQWFGTAIRQTKILQNNPEVFGQVFIHRDNVEIVFTDRIFETQDVLMLASSIVHEGRHIWENHMGLNGHVVLDEYVDPGHVFCTRGVFQDEPVKACDERLHRATNEELAEGMFDTSVLFRDGSGYSIEFAFLMHVRDHPIATNKVKKEAQERLDWMAAVSFNSLDPGAMTHYRLNHWPEHRQ